MVPEDAIEIKQRLIAMATLFIHVSSESLTESVGADILYLKVVFVLHQLELTIDVLHTNWLSITFISCQKEIVFIRTAKGLIELADMFQRV